jgi:hypothetical protein
MDTPYEKIPDEIRSEWLEHPTTIAYLRTVAAHRKMLETELINRYKCGGHTREQDSLYLGGEIQGLHFADTLAHWGHK